MRFPVNAAAPLLLAGSVSGDMFGAENAPRQAPLLSSTVVPKSAGIGANKTQPNIVFIITDDQDKHLDSLEYMPLVKKHLTDKGIFYDKHFATTAICCPSRVSLWTGKLAHNTNVTDVSPPWGGYPKFVSQGFNDAYLPLWLQEAGYNTYYTGKLFNAHTVDNYNNPYPAGWNGTDFLLDPYTYQYLNSTYQHNQDPPVSYPGLHTTDILRNKTFSLLDSALADLKPFFLGVAPIAPHSNVEFTYYENGTHTTQFSQPIPEDRFKNLFPNVTVPRTPNFNPNVSTGASWIKQQKQLTPENIAYNDEYHRNRLRTLQGVDELVDELFARLEAKGLQENTYVFYTADNGFHISQHRLQPGKECGFEEDINVPLIIRGPGIPAGRTTSLVTTHIDLAPTLLKIAGGDIRSDFDGEAIPLSKQDFAGASDARHEHVTVEFWGTGLAEGEYPFVNGKTSVGNNTYKAVRIASNTPNGYNLYYSVWCDGSHQLYDLATDPYEISNLLDDDIIASGKVPSALGGVKTDKVAQRLDALLLVLKSCKGDVCIKPWGQLHSAGNVQTLTEALSKRFDEFYEKQVKVEYDHCEAGYILSAEGPQFEDDGLVYRHGSEWHNWI